MIPETNDNYAKAFSLTKDKIIDYYCKHNLILVMDDFHYTIRKKDLKREIGSDITHNKFKHIVFIYL